MSFGWAVILLSALVWRSALYLYTENIVVCVYFSVSLRHHGAMIFFYVPSLMDQLKKRCRYMEDKPPASVIQQLLVQNEALKSRVSELEGTGNASKQNKSIPVNAEGAVSKRAAVRQREAAANAEISQLKLELAIIRAEGCPGYLARERKREDGSPILPKRALTLAGYWNVMSNDILKVTPLLVAAVEAKGVSVMRRDGMHLCFFGKDRRVVIESVLEIMLQMFPQYQRRRD